MPARDRTPARGRAGRGDGGAEERGGEREEGEGGRGERDGAARARRGGGPPLLAPRPCALSSSEIWSTRGRSERERRTRPVPRPPDLQPWLARRARGGETTARPRRDAGGPGPFLPWAGGEREPTLGRETPFRLLREPLSPPPPPPRHARDTRPSPGVKRRPRRACRFPGGARTRGARSAERERARERGRGGRERARERARREKPRRARRTNPCVEG